jgi:L-amino acid N-acyltransferase YncA
MGYKMEILIREYKEKDIPAMIKIWNNVVDAGTAFSQKEKLTENEAYNFFSEQSFTGLAENIDIGDVLGLYILHPNNIGRCGHISNASYAVRDSVRRLHIGEGLVKHSMEKGKELGFKILQFNAVVKTNVAAIHLYEKLGFIKLGVIQSGFLMNDGSFEDIIPFYHTL